MLAEVYDHRGLQEKALEQYQRALALDPSNSLLRIGLAEHYYTNGRMEDAYRTRRGIPGSRSRCRCQDAVLIGFFEMTENEEKPDR
ncbi:MAG: tetratricopeptide repeat protein [Flavobacteriales bacterium]|nr:tetratricopeptide repeat protein [Flavobacteriales bacterium]